jgi:tetratricopeptide (TPR) repeat protein
LIDRVSEYERELITEEYYGACTGELDQAIYALRLGRRNYPRWWGFVNNLSEAYISLGQFEDGLKEGKEAARLQPNVEPPYRRQLDAYICLDRLAEAKQLAEQVRVQGLDGARIHQRFLEMAYVEDDPAAAAREIQWFAGKPEEYLSLGLQAAHRNVLGQRSESRKLYQQAAEAARAGVSEAPRLNSRMPMRVPTRCRITARLYAALDVLPWPWRCAAMSPKRRSSPQRLPNSFQMEPSGTGSTYRRFARL